jgi:hypothetical protein
MANARIGDIDEYLTTSKGRDLEFCQVAPQFLAARLL